MSDPKHTPGPWDVTPMGGQAISPRDGYFVSSADSLGVRTDIAHVRPCPTHTSGELEANVQLIAAAPELLAALEEYVRISICTCPLNVIRTCNCCRARAAIAKARGKS